MYLFTPCVSEDQVGNRVLVDVVDHVLNGSASAVMMKRFDVRVLDTDELRELRSLFNRTL